MARRMTALFDVPDDWTADDLESALLTVFVDGAPEPVAVVEVHAEDLTSGGAA